MRLAGWTLTAVVGLAAGAAAAAPPASPPVAAVEPVTDTYFGTSVTDPYRWMEDRTAPRFVDYLMKENAYARGVIDRIPGRDRLQTRIAAHTGAGVTVSQVQTAGDRIFYLKRGPDENSFKLYVREGARGPERLLLDPDRHAADGHHFAIDYYQPSNDGSYLVYGVSPGGSEQSVMHILDVASGAESAETIDRGEFGSPSWLPDGSGFFYTRTVALAPGEPDTHRYLNARVFLHRLGRDPAADPALLGTGVPGSPPMEPQDVAAIVATPGADVALAVISHGSEPAERVLVAPLGQAINSQAPWRTVAERTDDVVDAQAHGRELYLLTHKDAPRYKVVEVDAAAPDLTRARIVAPAGERVIEAITPAADGLYIRDLDGGLGLVRRYEYANGALSDVTLPIDGAVTGPVTDPLKPGALLALQGWVSPPRWYAATSGAVSPLPLTPPWAEDVSGYVAEETQAPAEDGTMIPLSIVHRRGVKLDAKTPVWMTAYGAYGISLNPSFAATHLTLLEDGGVLAVCHVRGGGEFGEAWHLAGQGANKPNTYRDLIACSDYLVRHGYGSPSSLAIESRSAGGITVGMAMTERPDLFRVVFSGVGDSNALRAEFETDGAANALEYGSVKTEAGFRTLAAVDALSHVKDHTAYPAVLLTTGLNDPRVAPWQPGKMAARLQAASDSGRPILLLVDTDAGHGMGSTKTQRDRERADQLAFFYWQIGKSDYQPAP